MPLHLLLCILTFKYTPFYLFIMDKHSGGFLSLDLTNSAAMHLPEQVSLCECLPGVDTCTQNCWATELVRLHI